VPQLARTALIGTVSALSAIGLALPATSVSAVSPDVVVAEVYGGGGNSGATYRSDFIELSNAGPAPVSLEGWSVQYATATGSSWQVTPLSGSIAPGARYLVRQASGSGGTTDLPAPDAAGSIAMSATAGKVALVTDQAALACSTGCTQDPHVRDLVGFGSTASSFEGTAPTAAPSNTTSVARTGADSDDNGRDFQAGAPTPQNSASDGGPPSGVPGLEVHDIQGAAHRSPYTGRNALDVPGVVTAVRGNGFWMQAVSPDDDVATSEGVFVFRPDTLPSPGDQVAVTGEVEEYRAATTSLSLTEISGSPTVEVLANGRPLPSESLVGPGGRLPPGEVIDDDATGSVETSGSFDATTDGIDFWESMEGMRVAVDDARVTGPTSRFGETPVAPVGSGPRSARGGLVVAPGDFNPERVLLDDLLSRAPAADTGDLLAGRTIGVLDYSFANFKLLPSSTPAVLDGGVQRESTVAADRGQFSVASYNVENLDARDPQAKYDALATQIVGDLQAPDVVGLEEVQDDNGPVDDGTVSATRTLHRLVASIEAAGGPTYHWRQIDPVDGEEGGEPGGNIRVAFLLRSDRGVRFVDRGAPTSSTAPEVVRDAEGEAHLAVSPARVAPASAAWEDSRVPLVGEFVWNDRTFFVVANHFTSKGGDRPLFGRYQPPTRSSETKRHLQAQVLRDFVDDVLTADPDARVAVVGDINDFEFSETVDILAGSGRTQLTDLPRTLPAQERYTYVYEGNSQVLDHILLSPRFVKDSFGYDIVHVNAEFRAQASDHDPQVVRLGNPNEFKR
jgi:predicted extracellular nuclease